MLNLLHGLALRLYPRRGWVLGLAALFCFVLLLLSGFSSPETTHRYAIPAIVAITWSALLSLLIADFQSPPPFAEPGMGRWGRIKIALRRFGYWLLALLFVGSTALASLVSLRLLMIWIHDV